MFASPYIQTESKKPKLNLGKCSIFCQIICTTWDHIESIYSFKAFIPFLKLILQNSEGYKANAFHLLLTGDNSLRKYFTCNLNEGVLFLKWSEGGGISRQLGQGRRRRVASLPPVVVHYLGPPLSVAVAPATVGSLSAGAQWGLSWITGGWQGSGTQPRLDSWLWRTEEPQNHMASRSLSV